MKLSGFTIIIAIGVAGPGWTQPATTPTRTPLGVVALAAPKTVTRIQVMRVDFTPGQAMPRHLHPAPVVCYVETGAFHVEIAGQPARDVTVGQVTYEPADTPVERFQNISAAPGALICNFLAGPDDTELSRLLPPR